MRSSSYFHPRNDKCCFSEILAIDTPHPRNPALYRLTKQLLQKYHKAVRPVHHWTEATMVYLDVFVHAVLDVVRTILPFPIPITLFCKTTCCLCRSLVELVGKLY